MFMEGLGRLFDIGNAVAPVDINTSDAATGARISMTGHTGIAIVLFTLVGGADNLTVNIRQHTAYTSGTSSDLDSTAVSTSRGIDHFYLKAETALDNDEAWVKITQTEASECVILGATYGTQQKLAVIQVGADQMGDGYTHLSADIACTTSTSQLLAALYIPYDLAVQRAPVNRPNLLRPGAANA